MVKNMPYFEILETFTPQTPKLGQSPSLLYNISLEYLTEGEEEEKRRNKGQIGTKNVGIHDYKIINLETIKRILSKLLELVRTYFSIVYKTNIKINWCSSKLAIII